MEDWIESFSPRCLHRENLLENFHVVQVDATAILQIRKEDHVVGEPVVAGRNLDYVPEGASVLRTPHL